MIHSLVNYRLHCFQAGHPHELQIRPVLRIVWVRVQTLPDMSDTPDGFASTEQVFSSTWDQWNKLCATDTLLTFHSRLKKMLRGEGVIEE